MCGRFRCGKIDIEYKFAFFSLNNSIHIEINNCEDCVKLRRGLYLKTWVSLTKI